MPRKKPRKKESVPVKRAAEGKKEVERLRRKYKVSTNRRKRFLPGEEAHIADMVVVLKLAGYSNTQVAKATGCSRKQVAEFLGQKVVQEKLISLRAMLPQAALDLLQGLMIEAVVAVADVMRSSEDDKFVLQAAFDILDRGGIPKSSRQERKNLEELTVNLEDGGMVEKLRQLPVEKQEEAAQMIEKLEEMLLDVATGTEDGNAESS